MKEMLNIKMLLIVFLIACFFGPIVKAQQTNFIYIQADHNKPFYVVTNNKTYQSSEVGYLIIPKLTQGKHEITIGFPDNSFPAQKFSISIDKKDLGFALKNMEEKGWALASVHNKELIYGTGTITDVLSTAPDSAVETKISAKEDKKTSVKSNAFGQMLAEVVNDPGILQPTVLPDHPVTYYKAEMQASHQSAGENHETGMAEIKQSDASDSKTTELNEPFEASSTKGVIKVSQKDNKDGTDLVFIDFKDFTNDTIRVFIPFNETRENNSTVKPEKPVVAKNDSPGKKNGNEPGFIDMNTSSANNSTDKDAGKNVNNPFFANEKPKETTIIKEEKTNDEDAGIQSKGVVNANCNKMIAEAEVEKLKKRMISLDNVEMVKAAKKALKGKCITTQQVSDLSGLFLSDEGRYNFYDAVYPFVYDTGNYKQLEDQLLDIYYKNRFKALIGY